MAIVNGTNYAKLIAALPSARLGLDVHRGPVRLIEDIYECAATLTSAFINVGRLYKGDRIVGGYILFDTLHSTAGTIELGDDCSTADSNRYLVSGAAAQLATGARIDIPNIGAIDTTMFTVDADCNLQVKLMCASATGTIRTKILVASKAER